jgi:hypothetical protein
MTWDANIDSTGPDGNAPYAYSLGIQSILKTSTMKKHLYKVHQMKTNRTKNKVTPQNKNKVIPQSKII